jgi:hypothetical protein
MAYHRPAGISAVPASTPSDLLSELEAIIVARNKLREEQEKVSAETTSVRLQWTRELALEAAKGVNIQSVVTRCKDLEGKEQRYREQRDSLARSLREIDDAIRHYEQAHRQDLLQALQVRLEQVGEARKEYEELEKWRDVLLRKAENGKPARGARRASGGTEADETS